MRGTLFIALALAAAEPQPAEVVYRIDPAQAEAAFDLKATLHTVHGTTRRVTGEVRATERPGGVLDLAGRIEVEAAALDTGNDSRDKTMREESLAVAEHPVIAFVPERFDPATGKLTGALTIRGVTKPVTIDAKLTPRGDARVRAEGTFEVAWEEFGVPDPSFAFVRIKKTAQARFSAELSRVSP